MRDRSRQQELREARQHARAAGSKLAAYMLQRMPAWEFVQVRIYDPNYKMERKLRDALQEIDNWLKEASS